MKMGKLGRLTLLGVLMALVAALLAGCGGDGKTTGGKKFLNIATGGTAGTYY
ncbi:MAG: C4-dicarboxylate ABC transporter substrate-binding protein, partial [Negativicutes bacterium]